MASYTLNGNANDSTGNGHNGKIHNAYPTSNHLGNGSSAYSFNGNGAYIEIPDHSDFSVTTTGKLTISVWMRPGTLTFQRVEDPTRRYVHWMGKGGAGQQEWTFRMYSSDNTNKRGNRVSFYLFNLTGGQGAGAYVQEPLKKGTWYHYVAVADMSTDTLTWYKNGDCKGKVPFMHSKYHISPRDGTAPVRIGTKDFGSYFKGAIDNIYIYNRALSDSEISLLYNDQTP